MVLTVQGRRFKNHGNFCGRKEVLQEASRLGGIVGRPIVKNFFSPVSDCSEIALELAVAYYRGRRKEQQHGNRNYPASNRSSGKSFLPLTTLNLATFAGKELELVSARSRFRRLSSLRTMILPRVDFQNLQASQPFLLRLSTPRLLALPPFRTTLMELNCAQVKFPCRGANRRQFIFICRTNACTKNWPLFRRIYEK